MTKKVVASIVKMKSTADVSKDLEVDEPTDSEKVVEQNAVECTIHLPCADENESSPRGAD